MPNKKPKNIAIIGAGIIGLYLAWKLSKKGYKVNVFEKEKSLKDKPCSGLISERLKNFVPFDNSIVEKEIDSCLIHFPKTTIRLNFKPKHLVINRKRLNETLLKLAKISGAEILFNHPIKKIPEDFHRIIGCDGAMSIIREQLLLAKPFFRLGLQMLLPIKNSSNQVETWQIKTGFCWKIPKGKETEYGALGQAKTVKKDFENFCKEQKIDIKKYQVKSAFVPQGIILPKNKKITLCGDAVGLTKPWSGGGVIWGLTAADILIKNFPDFEKYHKEVKKFFSLKILKGKIITKLVYFLGQNFPYFLPKNITRDNDFPVF